ncbi:MAG: tetratricopeptide repeat protein [Hyphomonadaceae bacterium]|nr:tetratricopeptide repeat protein [Hyphomonadaceae bacterium]
MEALRIAIEGASDWLRPVGDCLTSIDAARLAGELALGALFGAGAKDPAPPAPPPPPPAAPEPAAPTLSAQETAFIERGLNANAAQLALPVPGPPPAGPYPKHMLRAALGRFLKGGDVRGPRVVELVAERCIQEAYDLAVVMAEDLEVRTKGNGGAPVAARAWADAGAIAYINHPRICLARIQKAHELGADDVEMRLWLGTLYYRLGRIGEAESCYRGAESAAGQSDPEARAAAIANLGCVAVPKGDHAAAEAHFQNALRMAEQRGDKAEQSALIGNLGLVAYTKGDLVGAADLCRRALVLAEEAGDLERAALQYGNLGVVAHDRGDDKMARDYYKQALDLYDDLGQSDHPGARNVIAHIRALEGYR